MTDETLKINRKAAIARLVDAGYSTSYAAELIDQITRLVTGKQIPGVTRAADLGRATIILSDAFATGDLSTSDKLRLLVTTIRAIAR